MARVLLVDDDVGFLDVLTRLLTVRKHEVVTCTSGQEALEALGEGVFDMVISDLIIGEFGGLKVLEAVRDRMPQVPVIVLTGYATVESALAALRMGAFDYVTKPFKIDAFIETVEGALAWRAAAGESSPPSIELVYGLEDVIAASAEMQAVCKVVQRVAPSDATVLVTGEKGVGKLHVCRVMHRYSLRREAPFIEVKNGSRDEKKLTAELFGSEDARPDGPQTGLVGRAHEGTLCLVNVEDLPLGIQQHLLAALGKGSVKVDEAGKEVPLKVRLMATTAADLKSAARQGDFDAKLYDRLSAISLDPPPLRKRRADILPLARHLLIRHAGDQEEAPRISAEAASAFKHYGWPGNASELEEAIVYAMKSCAGKNMEFDCLPESIAASCAGQATTVTVTGEKLRGRSLRSFLRSQEARLAKKVMGKVVKES